jgi:hypothetical protein
VRADALGVADSPTEATNTENLRPNADASAAVDEKSSVLVDGERMKVLSCDL